MNIYDPIAALLKVRSQPEIYENISYEDHPSTKITSWNKGKTGVQDYNEPWNKGLKGAQSHTEEFKKDLSVRTKGIPRSAETKEKIRSGNLGKKRSHETREKIRRSVTGKKWTDDAKNKLSLARTGGKLKRNKLTCPSCGKTGFGPNMKRYHFDNCRS